MLLLAERRSVKKGDGGRGGVKVEGRGTERKGWRRKKGKGNKTVGDEDQSSGPEHLTSASPRSPG